MEGHSQDGPHPPSVPLWPMSRLRGMRLLHQQQLREQQLYEQQQQQQQAPPLYQQQQRAQPPYSWHSPTLQSQSLYHQQQAPPLYQQLQQAPPPYQQQRQRAQTPYSRYSPTLQSPLHQQTPWQPPHLHSRTTGLTHFPVHMGRYGQNWRLPSTRMQELRLHSPGNILSTSEALTIPARWDAEVGHHIILLSDVQLVSKKARHFLNNGEIVPFIKDHNSQELIPLRIKYRHGVVLDVFEPGTNANLYIATASPLGSVPHIERSSEEDPHSQQDNGFNSLSTHQQITGVTIMECDVDEDRDDGAANLASCTESSLLAHIHLYGSYINGMMSSQETGMSEIQNSIKNLVENMTQEIAEDWSQLLQMSEFIHELVPSGQEGMTTRSNKQDMEQYVLEKQQQILQAQQRGINRLVTIQENVQDSAAMVFTALDRSLRRLFVVLPFEYSSGSYNGFRLFFLCEYGHRLATGDRSSLPNIHLARHEGYELQDPDGFFQDYTSYLMSIFHILKNGIDSPELYIRRLSHMTLAEGVVEVQDVLKLSDNTIQSLINETISYMHDQGYYNSTNRMDSRLMLDVIESTDLRLVLKHLKCYKRNGHTPGELRQAITSEKDVKWVCADHYHENDRGVAVEYQDEEGTDEAYEHSMDEKVQTQDVRSQDELAETLFFAPNSMEWTDRERTIIALTGQAEQDDTVLQALTIAVADPDKNVREAAVRVLRDLSKVSHSARDAVISAVYDTQWNVQEAVMQVLGDLLHLSRKDLSLLVSAAGSDLLPVKYAAMDALIKHANSESVFLTLVETIRSSVRTEEVAATKVPETRSQSPKVVVDVLIDTLGDGSQDEREYVMCTLQSQSKFSGSATQALPEKFRDEDSDVREAAIRTLDNQNSISKSLIPTLITGLNDKSIGLQTSAAQTLGGKYNLLQSVVQELFGSLSRERVNVRGLSAIILAGQDALSKESIQALAAILSDKTLSVREATVQALGSPSLQSQSAIENLVGLLEDDDPKVRGAAVYSLGRKRKMPELAVQALIRTLDDGDLDVQEKAIRVLGVQAASYSKVVDALLQPLESQNDTIRNTTIAALSRDVQLSDVAIQKLVINLLDKRDYVGAASAKVLCNHTKWSESAVEALVKAVLGEDAVIRRRAAIALMSQDKLPEAVVGKLIAALKTNNRTVFPDVLSVLGGEVNSSEAVVETLIGFLCEINMHIRRSAEEGLLNLTQISESAIQLLKGIIRDKPPAFRISALNILSKHVHTSEAVALIILNAFKDANVQVKNAALQVLHRSGLPESIVLQQLETLKNGDKPARDAVTNILSGLPRMPENAAQALIECLKDDDKEIRKAAALSLKGQVRREDVIQALTVALSDSDSNVRHASVTALETLSNKVALPDATTLRLITLLKDNFKAVRDTAGGILGGLPNMSREDVQVLIKYLKDDNKEVRIAAALALKGQVRHSDDAVQALIQALKDADSRVRHGSVTVLRELCHQVEQPRVVLELVKALKDDDSDVRDAANDVMSGFMGMFNKDTFQELASQLDHQNWEIRAVAVRLISRQLNYLEEIVDALTIALRDIDARVRVVAVTSFKGLPYAVPLPDSTVLELIRAILDTNSEVRCTSKTILGRLPVMSGYVIRTLIEQLRDNDGGKETRENVAQVLIEQFKPKLATLQAGLFIPDKRVERFADATIQDLIDILQDDEPVVSQGAEAVLKRRTTFPEFATAALVAALSDTRHHVSDGAHRVLHRQNLDVLNRVGAATLNEDEEEGVTDTDNDYKFS